MGEDFLRLVPIQEAEAIVEANVPKLEGFEVIPLMEASSRVLYENLYAPIDLPPFDRALMDGYAVVAADTFRASEEEGVILKITGSLRAGRAEAIAITSGEAVEIATGAPLPEGADAVVMVEQTEKGEVEEVMIYGSVVPGENIQVRGTDIKQGELLFPKGRLIASREIGAIAAVGIEQIKVMRKPRVAVLSTGDELELPGKTLVPGKIFDANTYMIMTRLLDLGADAIFRGRVRDRYSELLKAVRDAIAGEFDIIILSGGTSAGRGDMLYRVVEDLGELLIHGVMIKPGKPFIFGVCAGISLFGLPGYPVSAMITFERLIEPVIRRMVGIRDQKEEKVIAEAGKRIHSARGRYEFMPVKLENVDESLRAMPVSGGSGAIRTLVDLDGYIAIEEEVEIIEEGEAVCVVKKR